MKWRRFDCEKRGVDIINPNMKITKIKLRNFRSYQEEVVIPFKDMNIILGKNDAWKSSILEAMDIFFNDNEGAIKIWFDDINKNALAAWESELSISVCFTSFDDTVTLETVPTSISGEYLLNQDGEFEVIKIYKWKTMWSSVFIRTMHPSNDQFLQDLLMTKVDKLQKYIRDHSIELEGDGRVSSVLRKAIRKSYGELSLQEKLVPADEEGAKEIWDKIEIKLPTYILFRSDRSNTDQDNEVQNPMSIALKNILAEPEVVERLTWVHDRIKEESQKIAQWTLAKLQWINPELARQLNTKSPEYNKLWWNKAFPKTEIESDNIPLNKRWSWVKRMILLSFFLNEIERRKTEEWLWNVIYAFEEPETSQHPAHQQILINSFRALSTTQEVQVLLTTHSPYVYKDCLKDPNIQLIHVDNFYPRTISDIRLKLNNLPKSPTWGEINHFVYWLYTYEFFDELYSHLEELCPSSFSHVDDFIVHSTLSTFQIQKSERWQRAKTDGTPELDKLGNPIVNNSTYVTCIRHQIHHPNNNLNTTDYTPRLSQAIDQMLAIIN